MGYTFRNCSWDDTTASVSANATQEVLHMCHGEWLEAASSPSGRQFQAKSTSPLWGLMVPLFCYLGLLSTTNIMGQHYKRALSLITLLPDFLAKDTWKKTLNFNSPWTANVVLLLSKYQPFMVAPWVVVESTLCPLQIANRRHYPLQVKNNYSYNTQTPSYCGSMNHVCSERNSQGFSIHLFHLVFFSGSPSCVLSFRNPL